MSEKLYLTWNNVYQGSKHLVKNIRDEFPDQEFKAVLAVTRGGMFPAMIVASELDIRMVETICITSYEGEERGGINIVKLPSAELCGDGEGILVVDDLVDSGETYKAIRELLPNATYATLFAKPDGQRTTDTYATWVSQNTWVCFPWES